MKFWLTLIVGTVVISAGLTWLTLHQGAQALPDVRPASITPQDPPRIVFEKVNRVANVVTIEAPDAPVDQTSAIELPFKNDGKGPLRIQLTDTSCGCVHDILINGTRLEKNQNAVEIPAGAAGVLKFTWVPKRDQLKGQPSVPLLISADLLLNDPQFLDVLRFEVKTRIVPAKERTS